MEQLIELEIKRQTKILERGEQVSQQTLSFDALTAQINVLRAKSDAHDYRYFPEPDLLPVLVEQSLVEHMASRLPELPDAKKQRLQRDYALPAQDASFLTATIARADYFEQAAKHFKGKPAKKVANWIMAELYRLLNEHSLSITESPVPPESLAELLNIVASGEVSGKMAKAILQKMFDEKKTPQAALDELGFKQISDQDTLAKLAKKVLADHPKEVTRYQQGEKKLLGLFVGQVMKHSQGQANPQKINSILLDLLR